MKGFVSFLKEAPSDGSGWFFGKKGQVKDYVVTRPGADDDILSEQSDQAVEHTYDIDGSIVPSERSIFASDGLPIERGRRARFNQRANMKEWWVDDKMAKQCYECRSSFGTFTRRHHCRVCGQVFCWRCSDNYIPGDELGYPEGFGNVRICTKCFAMHKSSGSRGGSPPHAKSRRDAFARRKEEIKRLTQTPPAGPQATPPTLQVTPRQPQTARSRQRVSLVDSEEPETASTASRGLRSTPMWSRPGKEPAAPSIDASDESAAGSDSDQERVPPVWRNLVEAEASFLNTSVGAWDKETRPWRERVNKLATKKRKARHVELPPPQESQECAHARELDLICRVVDLDDAPMLLARIDSDEELSSGEEGRERAVRSLELAAHRHLEDIVQKMLIDLVVGAADTRKFDLEFKAKIDHYEALIKRALSKPDRMKGRREVRKGASPPPLYHGADKRRSDAGGDKGDPQHSHFTYNAAYLLARALSGHHLPNLRHRDIAVVECVRTRRDRDPHALVAAVLKHPLLVDSLAQNNSVLAATRFADDFISKFQPSFEVAKACEWIESVYGVDEEHALEGISMLCRKRLIYSAQTDASDRGGSRVEMRGVYRIIQLELALRSSDTFKATHPQAAEDAPPSQATAREEYMQMLEDFRASYPSSINIPKWTKVICRLAWKAATTLFPRCGTDDILMDVREYIEVISLDGGDPWDSEYVSGAVIKGNVTNRTMPTDIRTPRILLVGDQIDYEATTVVSDFGALVHGTQDGGSNAATDGSWLEHLSNRVTTMKPDVVLVERSVHLQIQENLGKAGIALATNVSADALQRVRRTTQAAVVEQLARIHPHFLRAAAEDDTAVEGCPKLGRSECFTVRRVGGHPLMYICGGRKEKGCAMILRGACTSVLDQLEKIVKFSAFAAHNLVLETNYFRDARAMCPIVAEAGSISPLPLPLPADARDADDSPNGSSCGTSGVLSPQTVVRELEGAKCRNDTQLLSTSICVDIGIPTLTTDAFKPRPDLPPKGHLLTPRPFEAPRDTVREIAEWRKAQPAHSESAEAIGNATIALASRSREGSGTFSEGSMTKKELRQEAGDERRKSVEVDSNPVSPQKVDCGDSVLESAAVEGEEEEGSLERKEEVRSGANVGMTSPRRLWLNRDSMRLRAGADDGERHRWVHPQHVASPASTPTPSPPPSSRVRDVGAVSPGHGSREGAPRGHGHVRTMSSFSDLESVSSPTNTGFAFRQAGSAAHALQETVDDSFDSHGSDYGHLKSVLDAVQWEPVVDEKKQLAEEGRKKEWSLASLRDLGYMNPAHPHHQSIRVHHTVMRTAPSAVEAVEGRMSDDHASRTERADSISLRSSAQSDIVGAGKQAALHSRHSMSRDFDFEQFARSDPSHAHDDHPIPPGFPETKLESKLHDSKLRLPGHTTAEFRTLMIEYYKVKKDRGSDIPLGLYLAEHVTDVMTSPAHSAIVTRHYSHHEGRLSVVAERVAEDYGPQVMMWTVCKVCDETSPRAACSRHTLNFSFGKFLEASFYNFKCVMRCGHSLHADAKRCFGQTRQLDDGRPVNVLVTFDYTHVRVYTVAFPEVECRYDVRMFQSYVIGEVKEVDRAIREGYSAVRDACRELQRFHEEAGVENATEEFDALQRRVRDEQARTCGQVAAQVQEMELTAATVMEMNKVRKSLHAALQGWGKELLHRWQSTPNMDELRRIERNKSSKSWMRKRFTKDAEALRRDGLPRALAGDAKGEEAPLPVDQAGEAVERLYSALTTVYNCRKDSAKIDAPPMSPMSSVRSPQVFPSPMMVTPPVSPSNSPVQLTTLPYPAGEVDKAPPPLSPPRQCRRVTLPQIPPLPFTDLGGTATFPPIDNVGDLTLNSTSTCDGDFDMRFSRDAAGAVGPHPHTTTPAPSPLPLRLPAGTGSSGASPPTEQVCVQTQQSPRSPTDRSPKRASVALHSPREITDFAMSATVVSSSAGPDLRASGGPANLHAQSMPNLHALRAKPPLSAHVNYAKLGQGKVNTKDAPHVAMPSSLTGNSVLLKLAPGTDSNDDLTVIVRLDEPTSIIAYTLCSEQYRRHTLTPPSSPKYRPTRNTNSPHDSYAPQPSPSPSASASATGTSTPIQQSVLQDSGVIGSLEQSLPKSMSDVHHSNEEGLPIPCHAGSAEEAQPHSVQSVPLPAASSVPATDDGSANSPPDKSVMRRGTQAQMKYLPGSTMPHPTQAPRPDRRQSNARGGKTDLERLVSVLNETKRRVEIKEFEAHQGMDSTSGRTNQQLRFACTVLCARQFHAIRQCYCNGDESTFIASLSRCVPFAPTGGKTGANYYKTKDERFVLKAIKQEEVQHFEEKLSKKYFEYIASTIKRERRSVLVKIMGVFKVSKREGTSLQSTNWLLMENMFYNRHVDRMYDLKGSTRNRFQENVKAVLLDENLLLQIKGGEWIFTDEHGKEILHRAVHNDTLMLGQSSIMDYSMLLGVNDAKRELYIGIIDYMREYDMIKRFEWAFKSSGIVGGRGQQPTIVEPKIYKERFRTQMDNYFLMIPNKGTPWVVMHNRYEPPAKSQRYEVAPEERS